jgi:hypothetical protein
LAEATGTHPIKTTQYKNKKLKINTLNPFTSSINTNIPVSKTLVFRRTDSPKMSF